MQLLMYHIYEYNKGLRDLVLYTMNIDRQSETKELLDSKGLSYFFVTVNADKVNVFFGNEVCVRIIKSFGNKSLSDYTDEEAFMLGTMLVYDRLQQCERYVKRKNL